MFSHTLSHTLSQIRGSRRTQPFAFALAVVVLVGTGVVLSTLLVGVVRGMNRGDSLGLMKIDGPEPEAVDPLQVAPSRPAPAAWPVAETVGGEAAVEPALAVLEDDASGAAGPALGHTTPVPVVSSGEAPTFDGRPLRPVKTVRMLTTAYSPDERSCGIWADGITASGYSVWTNGMKLVAADTEFLPFGTVVTIPGYNGGRPVPVLDRGGAIKGYRLDVLYPTHERALQWGAQRLDVTVWEYAD